MDAQKEVRGFSLKTFTLYQRRFWDLDFPSSYRDATRCRAHIVHQFVRVHPDVTQPHQHRILYSSCAETAHVIRSEIEDMFFSITVGGLRRFVTSCCCVETIYLSTIFICTKSYFVINTSSYTGHLLFCIQTARTGP
jgi:hypothetical protein